MLKNISKLRFAYWYVDWGPATEWDALSPDQCPKSRRRCLAMHVLTACLVSDLQCHKQYSHYMRVSLCAEAKGNVPAAPGTKMVTSFRKSHGSREA